MVLLRKLTLLAVLSIAAPLGAHEIRPSVADVTVGQDAFRAEIRLTLEPLVAGIDLVGISDTNESPLSGLYDRYRAYDPQALESAFRDAWPGLSLNVVARSGEERIALRISDLRIPEAGDIELPRDSTLVLEGTLPPNGAPVVFGWAANLGPLIVRRADQGEAGYSAFLADGALSDPMPRTSGDDSTLIARGLLAMALIAALIAAISLRRVRAR